MNAENGQVEKRQAALQAVLRLGEACNYDPALASRVAGLCLGLFDELKELHQYGDGERFWLQCAALLHDIGRIEGKPARHKAALRIIQSARMLPFTSRERAIIGSIARYQRKALPDLAHDHYAALSPADRTAVSQLAALLRLGCAMAALFEGEYRLKVKLGPRKVTLVCAAGEPLPQKADPFPPADLFELAYGRKLALEWKRAQKKA